ncbi:MFS transporter [Nocardioides donggukensis]|uniref:MFS transporter n=1 Tax=Nocardioides donggukensis TaxID=2774019 RepID=A0A927Q3H6_9ACTN|nr:MFS transporter [Nocardioides donggukensis]MBD8870601.1 MFS transporter [Nocardioides donggukensis]
MRPHNTAGGDPVMTHHRTLLALLVSAQLVVMLDVSIVNVALPSIQADLTTGPVALTWVVNAYALAFGGLLLLAGRATDLLGRRRMFVVGSAVFTVGTLLAAASDHAWLLIAARAVQGVGASALSPAALSLLVLSFPGPARARAMGMWSAASAVGGAAGVVAGGVLAGSLGWRATFLVTVPITLVAAVAARRVLPADDEPTHAGLDAKGAVLLAAATIALVHGVLDAAERGWATAPVLVAVAVAAASALAFLGVERRSAQPLVPLGLFRSRTLSLGVGAALLGGAARASTFVLTALYLQQALHLAPMRAGLAMVPTSATVFVVSLVALPRLLRAHGVRRTMITGLLVLAAGHLWLAQAPGGGGYAVSVLPGLVLVAVGVALSFTPTTMAITSAVPPEHTGLASGMAGSATQVGAALGTAGFVSLGVAAGGAGDTLTPAGFAAAFTAAAAVALATAGLATLLPRPLPDVPGTPRRPRRVAAATVVIAAAGVLLAPAATRIASSDATGPVAAAGSPARDAVDLDAVDRYVQVQIEAASIPGAALAVTHGNRVVHLAGFGHDAEGVDVTPDSLFRVASLSKSFTALAVLQLVDDGLLGLDDPVVDHLAEFRISDPRGSLITVRQLLDQTSGLTDSTVHPMSRPQPATLEDAVADLAPVRLAAAPGTRWSYHNPNYQVAARLIEVVSGQPFDAYLHDHVFAPAGMGSSTTVDRDDDPVTGLADGHVVGWGHAFAVGGPGTFDAGDGGVVSSAADLARWLVVQTNRGRAVDGTRILSPSRLEEQHTPGDGAQGYGLGWDTDGPAGAPTRLAHSGNLLTWSAYMEVLPRTGYGFVILLNAGSGLMVDQLRIFDGLSSIIEGTDPAPAGAADITRLDLLLGAVTVGVAVLGTLGVMRAGRWSRRARARVSVSVGLRAAPHAFVLLVVLLYPHLAEQLVGGREVTWEAAAYGWPALTALVATVAAALGATWIVRTWFLGRSGARP